MDVSMRIIKPLVVVAALLSPSLALATAHFRWPASVEERLAGDVDQILGTGPQTVAQ